MKSITRSSALIALALAATVASTTAHATTTPDAITPTGNVSYQLTDGSSTNLPGYQSATGGYNFVFNSTGAAVGGAGGLVMDDHTTAALGVSNPSNPVSPNGFLALDADYPGALGSPEPGVTTTLSGLTAGEIVTVTFNFAGSQQKAGSDSCGNCTGAFDALLKVTLGGAAPTAGGVTLDAAAGATEDKLTTTGACSNESGVEPCIASQGFSGWESETLTFTVGSGAGNSVLSFIASDPNASHQDPAFALVDDVSITTPNSPAPEPSSLMLLGTGLAGLSGMLRSRFKKSAKV
jgi:hypothetical protein